MLSDTFAIGLALVALTLAGRPSTPHRSFGFQRAEILAAFVNGLTLVLVSGWIAWEAVQRFRDPPEILGGWMLAVAAVGLAVNVVAAGILMRSARESLNVEAALRHVVADVLGSVGVLAAALVILLTGWTTIDPIVSLAIAVLIVASAWSVLRDSTAILMEQTPSGIDADQVARAIVEVPGVTSVHDLHVWRITSGFDALSAHVLVGRGEDCHGLRQDIEHVLADRFDITHTTLQVDHDASDAPDRAAPLPTAPYPRRRGAVRGGRLGGIGLRSPARAHPPASASALPSASPSAGPSRRSRSAGRTAPCSARSQGASGLEHLPRVLHGESRGAGGLQGARRARRQRRVRAGDRPRRDRGIRLACRRPRRACRACASRSAP